MACNRNIWKKDFSAIGFILISALLFLSISSCQRFEPEGFLLVQDLTVMERQETAIQVSAVISDSGGEDVEERGFCWSSSPEPAVSDHTVQDGQGMGTFTATITGLTPSTQYHIRAYASNSFGVTYSNETVITTLTANQPPVVLTKAVTDITESTAMSGGEVTSEGSSGVIARGICWSLEKNPTVKDSRIDKGGGAGNFECMLDQLIFDYTYYVRAYAINATDTAYGEEIKFTTDYEISVMDFEGNKYKAVQIGDQVWMAENLRSTKYADGSEIPFVVGDSEWAGLEAGDRAYCWYEDDQVHSEVFGNLYNWGAVMNGAAGNDSNPSNIQGVCPDDWHVPSDAEWKELEIYLGMSQSDADGTGWRGSNEGDKLKEGSGNESDFMALPGGIRDISGSFGMNYFSYFWTATAFDDSNSWARRLGSDNPGVARRETLTNVGLSVRCIRD